MNKMKQISRSKLIQKQKCRGQYQVGSAYCPVGAFMSEYLDRENLNIIIGDCFFDAPEPVFNLISVISKLSPEGLRKYTWIADQDGKLEDNWINALGSLLWDAQEAGLIEIID